MNKASDLLTEEWKDIYSAGAEISRYKNKWVHFSSEMKLGVNPQKSHGDPYGIYFYPTNFINGDDMVANQFAADYPYYYICEPVKTARILDLSNLDRDTAYDIAERNGWGKYFLEVEKSPMMHIWRIDKKLHKKPGAIFYGAADRLANDKGRSWYELFKGLDGLKDSLGIINSNEPKQMVIFAKKNIRQIAFGTNKNQIHKAYENIYLLAVKTVDPNASLSYKNKTAQIRFTYNGAPILLKKMNNGYRLEYTCNTMPFFHTQTNYSMGVDMDYSLKTTSTIVSHYIQQTLKTNPPSVEKKEFPFDVEKLLELVSQNYSYSSIHFLYEEVNGKVYYEFVVPDTERNGMAWVSINMRVDKIDKLLRD